MGTAERKAKEKSAMTNRILDTAIRLFLDEGFENVSLRRIADKIEYSPSTIYLYFKDKNEILYALHTAGFEMLYERQKTILFMKDPLEKLRRHAELYIEFALENREYYDLMFIKRGPAEKIKEKEEWNIGLRSYDFLRQNVQECTAAGYIPAAQLDVATFSFWSHVHGIASIIIRDRSRMFPEEQIPLIIKGAVNFITDLIRKNKD